MNRRILAAAALLALTAFSCGEPGERESYLTAAEVCGSTLDKWATKSLEHMGATEKFKEESAGSSRPYSVITIAEDLRSDDSPQSCYVTRAESKSGHPLVQVDFLPSSFRLDRKTATHKKGRMFYPVGLYAHTADVTGATIYFKCSTLNRKTKTPYIEARLFSAANEISSKTTPDDLMIILNSMSRAVANHLGCAAEAQLPSEVPPGEKNGQ
ncbi:hypothetical protein AB0M23_26145 [Streptomyces sp. NPDC052077]|uniref:hypothetical protein n=1 Tax=Streptomyces sp. NPDC052077 TaxID=3154757 RepID=UPI0034191434